MKAFKEGIAKQVAAAVRVLVAETDFSVDDLVVETPPVPELGDISFPMFPLAKTLKMAPAAIAARLLPLLVKVGLNAEAAGPYINIHLNRAECCARTLEILRERGRTYGFNKCLVGEKIMIEFSSPNTNKPLHLGHLRNNAIGESLSRILKANGAEVMKVNLINDRGVHICKSMLAYKERGEGETPESTGVKSDHFVGNYYVIYGELAQEDTKAEERAQDMLKRWEAGDPEIRSLWKTMNGWAMDGLRKSYERTGIHFDTIYYESDTYTWGRDRVLQGLEQGLFYKDGEGTVWVDLDDIGLDRKVLLRKDGTSVYMTQDIGTALKRHTDWPFTRMFYVVANEQNYHFRVLFHLLGKLGQSWAQNLVHLSYGMVNLPEGRMKSREGTVVDADNLLDELHNIAHEEMREKGRLADLRDPEQTAEAVALAAVHYYLLQVSPQKDMIFNPEESLSFNGNTGPYLQYMGARISSMFRKHGGELPPVSAIDWTVLTEDIEWALIKQISRLPETVEAAGTNHDPSLIAAHLYELAKIFSRFYHEHPVLNCPQPELRNARLHLTHAVQEVLRIGFDLINIPFLEEM